MDRKTGFEDIVDEPRELEKNEGNWLKKVKIKFKAGESPQFDSEEDEKKRKDGKGKEMDSDQGKNRKMIKKANNNNKGRHGVENERKISEEENLRWKDSKGQTEYPKKIGDKKANNINIGQDQQGKKKFVAGKLRIVESLDGPTPKMIEVEADQKETKRAI